MFTRQQTADIIFDSWRYLQKERDLKLFACFILENHLHMVVAAPELPSIMQSFKSFTARGIIDLLTECRCETLLRQLRATKLNHKKDSEYQVWQEGGKPKLGNEVEPPRFKHPSPCDIPSAGTDSPRRDL